MLEKLKDIQSIVIARILRIGFHIASVRLTKHGGTAVLLAKRRGFSVRTVEVNERALQWCELQRVGRDTMTINYEATETNP